jgi:hypothetical protein
LNGSIAEAEGKLQRLHRGTEVSHEVLVLSLARFFIGLPQK